MRNYFSSSKRVLLVPSGQPRGSARCQDEQGTQVEEMRSVIGRMRWRAPTASPPLWQTITDGMK